MKAILVIDIDEKYIDSFGTEIQLINQKYNCKWKLKPMPNKKEENDDGTHFSWHSNDWWSAGWNACLEEIEKC